MRRFRWWAILLVVVASIVIATVNTGGASSPSAQQRIDRLATQVRCPTCAGLSVAQSEAPLARSAKDEITTQVNAGRTDNEIRAYFVSRYGDTALVEPKNSSIYRAAVLVPVMLAVVLLAALAYVVLRWRAVRVVDLRQPNDADRELVEAALRSRR